MEIAAVSNHLEPIPIPQEVCPHFRRIVEVTAVALACLVFAAALGGCIAFAAFSGGIVIGTVLGGVVGAVVGALLGFTIKHPSPEHENRLQTLDQLDKEVNPQTRKAIQRAKEFFSPENVTFHQAYDNHTLHDCVSVITQDVKNRTDLRRIWQVFLNSIQGLPATNPDGQQVALDFTLEQERLENKKLGITEVLQVTHSTPNFEADLDQLVSLQRECFTDAYTLKKEDLRARLTQPESGCFVIRCRNTNAIIGFLRYQPNDEGILCIAGIGRSGDAHNLHIGDILMQRFIAFKGNQDLALDVRASNAPAIHLYEKYEFKTVATYPSNYSYPVEDRHRMVRHLEKYPVKESKLEA